MAHADASKVEILETRPGAPLIPLSEIALTGIYEISKILNAPNRLETVSYTHLPPNPANAGNQTVGTGFTITALIWIKFLRLN